MTVRSVLCSLTCGLVLFPAVGLAGGVGDKVGAAKSAGVQFEAVSAFSPAAELGAVHTKSRWAQYEKAADVLPEATLLTLDPAGVAPLFKAAQGGVSFEVPFQNTHLRLDLIDSGLFADDFVAMFDGEPVELGSDVLGLHYQGTLSGEPDSYVAVSIFPDHVMGLINSPTYGELVLGPLGDQPAGSTDHILYKSNDLMGLNPAGCALDDSQRGPTKPGKVHLADFDTTAQPEWMDAAAPTKAVPTVDFYYEGAADITSNKGSQSAAVSWITGLGNQVKTVFANDGVPTTISGVNARSSDNWNNNDPARVLDQFSNQVPNFNGDTAMALKLRNFGGIAGSIGGMCGAPTGNLAKWYGGKAGQRTHAVSGIFSTYSNVPTYSFTVSIVAHEFGHVLGSPHTHGCFWNGNNSAIDGCDTRGTETHPTTGTCSRPFAPSVGTVMSYCNSTDLSNGFHSQVGSQLRSYLQTQSCLGGGGGPQPQNGSCYQRCGQQSGSCWCDSLCASYGDCCSDKTQYCG